MHKTVKRILAIVLSVVMAGLALNLPLYSMGAEEDYVVGSSARNAQKSTPLTPTGEDDLGTIRVRLDSTGGTVRIQDEIVRQDEEGKNLITRNGVEQEAPLTEDGFALICHAACEEEVPVEVKASVGYHIETYRIITDTGAEDRDLPVDRQRYVEDLKIPDGTITVEVSFAADAVDETVSGEGQIEAPSTDSAVLEGRQNHEEISSYQHVVQLDLPDMKEGGNAYYWEHSDNKYEVGDKVRLLLAPSIPYCHGYEASAKVTGDSGRNIEAGFEAADSLALTFTMPDEDVHVEVDYKKKAQSENVFTGVRRFLRLAARRFREDAVATVIESSSEGAVYRHVGSNGFALGLSNATGKYKVSMVDEDGNKVTGYGICVNPSHPAPPVGNTFVQTNKLGYSEEGSAKIRRILYYGTNMDENGNYITYNELYWFARWLSDGRTFDAYQRHIITHAALAYAEWLEASPEIRQEYDWAHGLSDRDGQATDIKGNVINVINAQKEVLDFYNAVTNTGSEIYANPPKSFSGAYLTNTNHRNQDLIVTNGVKPGYVRVQKKSEDAVYTDGKGLANYYSLEGAEFTLTSKEDPSLFYTLTTKADGSTNTVSVEEGTYTVEETKSPQGYDKVVDLEDITVSADTTTILEPFTFEVTEPLHAEPFGVCVEKVNPDVASNPKPMQNTVFQLSWYAGFYKSKEEAEKAGTVTRTFHVATTKQEQNRYYAYLMQEYVDAAEKLGYPSDSITYDPATGYGCLNYGTIVVEEVSPSPGYKNDADFTLHQGAFLLEHQGTAAVLHLKPGSVLSVETGNQVDSARGTDHQVYGGAKGVKEDVLTGTVAEGEASLAGAEFSVYNANSYNVKKPDGQEAAPGDLVSVMTTMSDGTFVSGLHDFPSGTYKVLETKSPTDTDGHEMYQINHDWIGTFTVPDREDANGQVFPIQGEGKKDAVIHETVTRGGVYIRKGDALWPDLSDYSAGMDLCGIQFDIRNACKPTGTKNGYDGRVVVEGKTYRTGETVATITVRKGTDAGGKVFYYATTDTDEDGIDLTLPYGTYTISEKKTETDQDYEPMVNSYYGDTLNNRMTFQIRENGAVVHQDIYGKDLVWVGNADQIVSDSELTDATDRGVSISGNNPVRGDLTFDKKIQETSQPLQAAFLLTNLSSGESHIVVTNASGRYHSGELYHLHSYQTNANDVLATEAGLEMNADGTIAVQNYDFDHAPVLNSHSMNPDAGTWFGLGQNGTMAAVSNAVGALPMGLYRLQELKSDTTKDFSGIQLTFRVGDHLNRPYADIDLGTLMNIEEHPEIESSTKGTIQDGVTQARLIYAAAKQTFSDEIRYYRLPLKGSADGTTIQYEYKVVGELHYATDFGIHKAGEVYLDASGNKIVAETRIKRGRADGSLEQKYTIDASDLGGAALVVYNRLYQREEDRNSDWHIFLRDEDTENERQRIYVPCIDTTALNTSASQVYATYDYQGNVTLHPTEGLHSLKGEGMLHDHIAKAGSRITVTDTVRYVNLLPNHKYTLTGYIVPKEKAWVKTGLLLRDRTVNTLHGISSVYGRRETFYDDVTEQVTFITPEGNGPVSGSQEVKFIFDVDRSLEGKDLVVFEELYLNISGDTDLRLWSTHEDTTDSEQQIKIPSLRTKAFDALTGDDVGTVEENTVLSDTVTYENVIAGRQYRVEGNLVNKADGKPILGDGNIPIRSSVTFTAEKENGSVTLCFSVPSSKYRNMTVNVYEDLILTNSEVSVAEHMKTEDCSEDVHFPNLHTIARDQDTGDHAGSIWGSLINSMRRRLLGENDTDGDNIADGRQQNIIDTVALENLVPGRKYTIKGTLFDEATREPVRINEKEISRKAEIEVTENGRIILSGGHGENIQTTVYNKDQNKVDGAIDLVYTLDSSKLKKGTTIVVYEDLIHNDVTVAEHHDLTDRAQAVNDVEIHTQAVDAATKDQVGQTPGEFQKTVTIEDTVAMTKLVRGYTYTVVGHLVDQDKSSEGKPVYINNKDGNPVTGTFTFRADESDSNLTVTAADDFTVSGLIQIPFDIDNSLIQGKTVTVFEDLYHNGVMISTHADLADNSQSIYYPTGKTHLTNNTFIEHTANPGKECNITDHVYFENLIVGKEYTISGKLMYQKDYDLDEDGRMDVNAGEALPDAGARTSIRFIASPDMDGATDVHVKTHADGTQTVSGFMTLHFTIDASMLKGVSIVAAERTSHNGVDVFVHENLEDLPQTIRIPSITTTARIGQLDESAIYNEDGSYKNITITDTVHYSNLWTSKLLQKLHNEGLGILNGKVIALKNPVFNIQQKSSYVMKGLLVDKETGHEVVDKNGKTYVSFVNFTPETENGNVDVSFTIHAEDFTDSRGKSSLEGRNLTVYEDLYLIQEANTILNEENLVASHHDQMDHAQDIHFPKGKTHANDGSRNHVVDAHMTSEASACHETEASGKMCITDSISYENLHGGSKYTVTGTLQRITARNEDGTVKSYEPAKDDQGNIIMAVKEFITEGEFEDAVSGTVDMVFGPFSGYGLAGSTTVAFEKFTRDGQDVMIHADINDGPQQIHIPKIHTNAWGNYTQENFHEAMACDRVIIYDQVTYSNLKAGEVYTVRGVLCDQETGNPIEINGSQITGQAVFQAGAEDALYKAVLKQKKPEGEILAGGGNIPEADQVAEVTDIADRMAAYTGISGTVTIPFTFDASAFAGKTLVVYETLYNGNSLAGKVVAEHKNRNDESQSIHMPKIRTHAMDFEAGNHKGIRDHDAVIRDEVLYDNLISGRTYIVTGVLMDKKTGYPILDADKKQVSVTRSFTAGESKGTVTMNFRFDPSLIVGEEVVVYEKLYDDKGVRIAAHEDIRDEAQTVSYKIPPTKMKAPKTGDLPPVAYVVALSACVVVISGIYTKKRKKHEERKL